jgi:hypothetical protein
MAKRLLQKYSRERERKKEQTTLERWCFSEHLMEIKLVLSSNVYNLE